MRLRSIFGTSAILAALLACGDDPTTVTDPPDRDLPRREVATTTVLVSGAQGPLALAGIVIETIDGGIVEQLTDRAGRVELLIPVDQIRSLLAHRDGYGFAAMSGAALVDAMKTRAGVQLYLDTLAPPAMADVNGVAWNMASDDNWLTVTATAAGSSSSQKPGHQFHLQVPANQPFTLIGLEWNPAADPPKGVEQTFFGWTATGSLGVERMAFMNLDFSRKLPTETVQGSFYAAGDWATTIAPYVNVTTYESGGATFLGAPTALTLRVHELNQVMPIERNTPPANWAKETAPPVVDFPYLMAQAEDADVTPYPEIAGRIVGEHTAPVFLYPLGVEDTHSAFHEGIQAHYTIEYVPLARATLVTNYRLRSAAGTGGVVALGAPIAGDSQIELPAPVVVATWPPPSLHEGVTWDAQTAENPFAYVDVLDETGTRIGWMMGNASEGTASCPPLPSTSNDDIFDGELTARVMTCQPSSELPGWCARYTESYTFDVVP